jgi:hypothetical protein
MEATSLRFATAARALGQTARRRGLAVPGFRSPPRLAAVDRSVRHLPSGHVMIAIRLRGRPWIAVVSDMIEGVLVANRLVGADADAVRRQLWACLEAEALLPAAPAVPPAPTVPAASQPPRATPARSVRVQTAARSRRADPPRTPKREAA